MDSFIGTMLYSISTRRLVSLPQPVDSLAERDSGVLLSAQTITSETISTTTTTQITKVQRVCVCV